MATKENLLRLHSSYGPGCNVIPKDKRYCITIRFPKRRRIKEEGSRSSIVASSTSRDILESYPILTLEEKNRLWKLVLKKVTIYRSADDEITIQIHPNLQK